jgi:hypothetical protein
LGFVRGRIVVGNEVIGDMLFLVCRHPEWLYASNL